MVLLKKTYVKKYVGELNTRLTNAYKKRGSKLAKGQKSVYKYQGLSAIKRSGDIVGYLVNGNIYSAKSSADRRKVSKQSWEQAGGRKSCGCGLKPQDKKMFKQCGCGKSCRCVGGCKCGKKSCKCCKSCGSTHNNTSEDKK